MKWIYTTFLASTLWVTSDQQGQRAYDKGEYDKAAELFDDNMWKGVSLYRAGEFKKAEIIFARLDSGEAHYNRGNCLVFMGLYEDAVASYDRALSQRPDWQDALINRAVAVERAKRMKREGGDMGDQTLGADEIVFDKEKKGGQETTVNGDQPTDASSMQAMWLRRVQTSPADFLKAKFAYQNTLGEEEK